MKFQLCKGSSEYLLDMCNVESWQAAKKEFKNRGYEGKFLLIYVDKTGFKIYNINIK